MSRSIHRTRRDLHKLIQTDYADDEKRLDELGQVSEELGRKRRIKAKVKGERGRTEAPLPPVDVESIPIRIHDQSEYIHYPASVEDLHAVMRLLPPGAINGIRSISLSLGGQHQPREDEGEFDTDPYTGRRGHEVVPGLFLGDLLGEYRSRSAKIAVFAYVYDQALPERQMWEFYMRLHMLSTFVHEVGHHNDYMERHARGRWTGDAVEKREMFAEKVEHEWTQQVVIPYLTKTYPAEAQALERWVEHHAGIKLPLDKLAGDPRTTLKGGAVSIRAAFGDIHHHLYELATDFAEGEDMIRIRVGFARNLHYSEHYAEALSVLDRVLMERGDDLEALTLQADIFVHQERYEEAQLLAEKVIALDEHYLAAWKVLADALEGLMNWQRLLEVTTHILVLVGDNQYRRLSALQQRTRANLELAEFDAAQKDIDLLTQEAPPYFLERIEILRDRLSSGIESGRSGQTGEGALANS